MRRPVLLVILLIFSVPLLAQNITGIWRGYFVGGMEDFYKSRYNYEVQFDQAGNGSLKGVTYSYRSTVFYGKAQLQGINMTKTRNIILKETKLVEVKVGQNSEPCLMTCYLTWSKEGNIEILQGTYTSFNLKSKTDCGAGTVYLQKVRESDFVKEDFLVKRTPARPNTSATQPSTDKTVKTKPNTTSRPPVASNTRPKTNTDKKELDPVIKVGPAPSVDVTIPEMKEDKPAYVPKVIRERENTLVRKIITNSKDIKIELYDNGEIDNDTITVYHNNELVTYKKRLSNQPITIRLRASEEDPSHEFVMVADNLGSIPPNTAMMILTTGGKRYELFISSTKQNNAKVIVEYRPD